MASATPSAHLKHISGTIDNLIYKNTRNGLVLSLKPDVVARLATQQQRRVRNYFTAAIKAWDSLTDAQRADWETYAALHFEKDADGTGAGPRGRAVYVKAAWYQQMAGLALPSAAPVGGVPLGIDDVTVQPAADETELQITVNHDLSSVTGYRLFVETTPRIVAASRKPQPGEHRAVVGVGVASIPALQATGTIMTFNPLYTQLNDGDRFGLLVRVVSPEGIPSPPLAVTLVQSVI